MAKKQSKLIAPDKPQVPSGRQYFSQAAGGDWPDMGKPRGAWPEVPQVDASTPTPGPAWSVQQMMKNSFKGKITR